MGSQASVCLRAHQSALFAYLLYWFVIEECTHTHTPHFTRWPLWYRYIMKTAADGMVYNVHYVQTHIQIAKRVSFYVKCVNTRMRTGMKWYARIAIQYGESTYGQSMHGRTRQRLLLNDTERYKIQANWDRADAEKRRWKRWDEAGWAERKSTIFTCAGIVAHNNNMDDNIVYKYTYGLYKRWFEYIEFHRYTKYTQAALANTLAMGSCIAQEAFVCLRVCVCVRARLSRVFRAADYAWLELDGSNRWADLCVRRSAKESAGI